MKAEEFIRLSGNPREKVGVQAVVNIVKNCPNILRFWTGIYPSGHFKAEKNRIFKDHGKRLI